MAATLDGVVEGTGAVFEAKFMLPWSFSEETAAEKHMAQVQHNTWVANASDVVLSVITGGGKWVEIKISADPLYQFPLPAPLIDRGKDLALCGERRAPRLFGAESPRVRIETVRVLDMSLGPIPRRNSPASFAAPERLTSSMRMARRSGGCEGGDRARGPRQTLKIWRGEF